MINTSYAPHRTQIHPCSAKKPVGPKTLGSRGSRKPSDFVAFFAVREALDQLPLQLRVRWVPLDRPASPSPPPLRGHSPRRPDRREIGKRVVLPGVVQASAPSPVHVFLELIHSVGGVEHVVQNTAREDVVNTFLGVVSDAELQHSETALQDAEKALHILSYAFKRPGEDGVVVVRRILGRGHEGRPLSGIERYTVANKKETGCESVGFYGRLDPTVITGVIKTFSPNGDRVIRTFSIGPNNLPRGIRCRRSNSTPCAPGAFHPLSGACTPDPCTGCHC